MKKKIIIAVFFATIMLLLPVTSALNTSKNQNNEDFEIPLSEYDQRELRTLISDEVDDVESELKEIITDEGTLKIDELEAIYEESIITGDSSVIESDSWDWILDRLGWIYITVEHVITIYNDALALYTRITQGSQVVQNWYNSVINLREKWQSFKQNPLNFNNIVNLLNAAITLIQSTINLIEYVSSQDLIDALNTFLADVQKFVGFLQSNPWNKPITIYGTVNNVDELVTISVKSDSSTTTEDYELNYTTSDSKLPWFVHKCSIKAEYDDRSFTKDKYAFSMGEIEHNIDKQDFNAKAKSKNSFDDNIDLFLKIQLLISKIFKSWNMEFLTI